MIQQNPFYPLWYVSNDNSGEIETTTYPSFGSVKPVRPGAKSYSDSVNGNKRSVIFSTSMTKRIVAESFNQKHYTKGKATFHRFHGGKARHIRHQVETHLYEERPDAAIILAGGNDLPTNRQKPTSIATIANQIMDIAFMCKKYEVPDICVSSVLPRRGGYMEGDMELRRSELNDVLRSLCDIYNFIFIDHDFGSTKITLSDHIERDGVHLNAVGSEVLAHSFGSVLNRIHSH